MAAAPRGMRIVLATYGSPGDLRPFLAIGTELAERGHDVLVATSAHYRDAVGAAGLSFAAVRPDRVPGQQEPDYLDRLIRERATPAAVFRAMFLPWLRESLDDLLPVIEGTDVIVSHTLATAAPLAAEAKGVPWISAVMQPMGYLSAHEPPVVGPAVIAAVLRALGPGPTSRVFALARTVTRDWVKEWDVLRAELGLPVTRRHPVWEGQHSAKLSLGLFPRCLGTPQPDWPVAARVTGFPFFRAPGRALDPSLVRFIAAGEPPLVFTLGTTAINDPGSFFTASAEAARQLGRRSILLVGAERRDGIPLPSRDLYVVPSVPHDLIFPHALAIVHQGGIGTLSEALLAGKPMLIMPYGHDQVDNAWRAARLGVARVIPRRRYRRAVVAGALERLLHDAAPSTIASIVARDVARENGGRRAADMIETAMNSSLSGHISGG